MHCIRLLPFILLFILSVSLSLSLQWIWLKSNLLLRLLNQTTRIQADFNSSKHFGMLNKHICECMRNFCLKWCTRSHSEYHHHIQSNSYKLDCGCNWTKSTVNAQCRHCVSDGMCNIEQLLSKEGARIIIWNEKTVSRLDRNWYFSNYYNMNRIFVRFWIDMVPKSWQSTCRLPQIVCKYCVCAE